MKRGEGIGTKLVRISRPIARIPTLAIHLSESRDTFKPNLHEHGKAIISMNASECKQDGEDCSGRMHPCLVNLIAKEIDEKPEDIVDLELQLIDTQSTVIGGLNNDLLYSGRLDNLCSSYQCTRALIDGSNDAADPLSAQTNVRIAVLFDHEEVGSNSAEGAGSSLFMDTLKIITSSMMATCNMSGDANTVLFRSLRKSFIVSIDMAHALHPNCK